MTACLQPITILNAEGQPQKFPCGRCDACLVRSRSDWAFRLREEWKVSESAFFITLTYDQDNLPITEVLDNETGALLYAPCVVKEDVQKFLRAYRKHFPPKTVRFYAISEYGKKRYRPHYHIIMFHKTVEDFLSIEEVVRKIWRSPEISVGPLDEGAVVYCTAYALTRKSIPSYFVPNFRLMSRKPGLGYAYIESNKDFHLSGTKVFVYNGSYKANMPRYYRDRIFDRETLDLRGAELSDQVTKQFNQALSEVGGDLQKLRRIKQQAIKDYSSRVRKTLDKKINKLDG